MKKCNFCDTPLQPSDNFCSRCGRKYVQIPKESSQKDKILIEKEKQYQKNMHMMVVAIVVIAAIAAVSLWWGWKANIKADFHAETDKTKVPSVAATSAVEVSEFVQNEMPTEEKTSVEAPKAENPLSYLSAGDIFTFGTYEQDNDFGNGKEEIEWVVLHHDQKNDRILVMSRRGLDSAEYDDQDASIQTPVAVSWASSSLYSWLNNYFYEEAFSDEEKGQISEVTIDGASNKLFVLSVDEYYEYLSYIDYKKCKATQYAKSNNAYVDAEGYSWWWLRAEEKSSYAPSINSSSQYIDYFRVNGQRGTVRPVMWIDLNT